MQTWIDRVLGAATEGKLVVLIGSGPSMDPKTSLPNWPGFVQELADDARGYQQARATLIEEELREGHVLAAAEYYDLHDRIPRAAREQFFLKRFDTPPENVPTIYNTIASLPARHWVTTNFDSNLKWAVDRKVAEVVDHLELKNVISMWSQKRFVVYLHGRAFKYDSLVYCGSHYRAIAGRPEFQEFMRNMFLRSTVLAYGYSFSDPDICEVLRFVADDLGGAAERTHVCIAPNTGSPPTELLRRANFELVCYDPRDGHAEGKRILIDLQKRSNPIDVPDSSYLSAQASRLNALVGLCMSLSAPGRVDTYQTAAAAIVLSTVVEQGGKSLRGDLECLVTKRLQSSYPHGSAVTAAGLDALVRESKVQLQDDVISIVGTQVAANVEMTQIIGAIERRFATYRAGYHSNSATRKAIRDAITYVLVVQGMTIAKMFANQDQPEAYSIETVVNEALSQTSLSRAEHDPMARALIEVLSSPEPDESRLLFRLAHAAFALETVFLNPCAPDPAELLSWRIYLDSNVVMRLLSPSSPQCQGYRSLFRRLNELRTPLYILSAFVREIVSHANAVGAQVTAARVKNNDDIGLLVEGFPAREQSPFLIWYAADCLKNGFRPFPDFARDKRIDCEAEVETVLRSNYGVITEGRDATRRFDTSRRESVWDALRTWRGGQKSVSARRLRRNEATQVEWLDNLRSQGTRAWFMSMDGQLRQALKWIEHGHFSGFVVTPDAWAHRLRDLHWKEVDFAGFSEMMWALPEPSYEARLEQLTIRRVVEKLGAASAGLNIEQLRDEVEAFFQDKNVDVLISAEPPQSRDQAFEELAGQLLPPAVEKVLDAIAEKQMLQHLDAKPAAKSTAPRVKPEAISPRRPTIPRPKPKTPSRKKPRKGAR
jgi:hypothetical protein